MTDQAFLIFFLFMFKIMTADNIRSIPLTFSIVILSLKNISPTIEATKGSIVARTEAFPASVFLSPVVYSKKGSTVHTKARAIPDVIVLNEKTSEILFVIFEIGIANMDAVMKV